MADEREAVIVAVGDTRRVSVMGEENNRSLPTEEVQIVLAKLKAGMAAGEDGCPGDCLTKYGKVIVEWLVRLFNVCFREGTVLLEWRSACVVLLCKGKGDKFECSSFRGNSYLSVVGKVYGRVLVERIRCGTESMVNEEQSVFRKGRGCLDQAFLVRQVCEKYLRKRKEAFFGLSHG